MNEFSMDFQGVKELDQGGTYEKQMKLSDILFISSTYVSGVFTICIVPTVDKDQFKYGHSS